MRQLILDLIKASNPVTLQDIITELKIQTDFFEKFSTLSIELEVALALETLISEGYISLDIDIDNKKICFDIYGD